MLSELKEKTKECHSDVEKVLVFNLKNLKTLEDYSNLLKKMHRFFEPLERKIQQLIDEDVVYDIKARMHVEHLKQDLLNLQEKPIKSNHTFYEEIFSVSYALGVLYVIEGSTLGGQIISKMLKKQMPLLENNQLNYFISYGENTHEMWSSFKNSIENTNFDINKDEMIKGAKDTFNSLKMCLLS